MGEDRPSFMVPLVAKATEGAYRRGPYSLPITGGFLPDSWGQNINWWQLGYTPIGAPGNSAIVEACVSAYAQTVAMLPGDHWYSNDKGGRDRQTKTALSRILRKPNDYQSISDFLLNLTRQLYIDGNSYAYCIRNDRYEITEMHLMKSQQCSPHVSYGGEIFYSLGGNDIIEQRVGRLQPVPMRDVLHVRLHTERSPHPLVGDSPLMAALADISAGDALKQQQLAFFRNSAKPSYVLSTDLPLDKDQVAAARERFMQMSTGENTGGVPILTYGLKPYPVSASNRDSQVAEIMKMSNQDVALAFRIPLQLLGLSGSPAGSTEALMMQWIASGLGFALNHIEEAFGRTFALGGQPDDYLELDTAALLRSMFKDRIEALARAVQGGILAPNEARNSEGYDNVEYGEEPRVQQQVVPLSFASAVPAAGAPPGGMPGQPKTGIPASPPSPPAPPQPAPKEGAKVDGKRLSTIMQRRFERIACSSSVDAR
jgi:HK97 family phage portal protein